MHRARSCRSYLPYSPGYCSGENRRPEAHLACFPDLILKAGAKLHADIHVLGLVRRRAAHVEAQPDGYHQGGILLPSLNLSFGATSTVSIVTWIMFPEDWPLPPRKGTACIMVFGGEPLEYETTLPHQSHVFDDEKVLVHGLFQPSANVPPLSTTVQPAVHQVPVKPSLFPTRVQELLSTTRQNLFRLDTSPVPHAARGVTARLQ